MARSLPKIDGIEAAIEANELLSTQRKAFLPRRLPYWREWASDDALGFTALLD